MVKEIYQYQLIRKLVEDGIQESVATKSVELLFSQLKDATENSMYHYIRFYGVGRIEIGGRPKKPVTAPRSVLIKQSRKFKC